MPRRKIFLFFTVLVGFLSIMSLSIIMTYPRYQKSMEQLPELILSDTTATNRALINIKDQLDENAQQDDGSKIVWTGSVCASKYMTLSGSERIYYVCPYIVAKTEALKEDTASNWTVSLQFAISALKDGQLCEPDTNIQVNEILFSCRVGENASILGVGYGDGEMTEVNGKSVNYQFRDRTHTDILTNVFARLLVGIQQSQKKERSLAVLPEEEKAVVNWSFQIMEKNHVIGIFNDVQFELPYVFALLPEDTLENSGSEKEGKK